MAKGKTIEEATLREEITGNESIPFQDGEKDGRIKTEALKGYCKPKMKTLNGESLEGDGNIVINGGTVDGELDPESTNPVQNKVISAALQELQYAVPEYGVAAWDADDLSPEPKAFYGNKDYLNDWHTYLLDTTDNTGEETEPVGELKRNNYLRFTSGTFAPTVGITEEQRAACDVELYLDNAQQQKYCDAGAFNAEAFYEEYGVNQKLYDSAGEEVRVLRPWETIETKYTIGTGRNETVYLLDNVEGNSGRVWAGLFSKPMVWDGVDVSGYPLRPTALAPCPVCTVDGKPRAFFFLYEGETNCQSSNGQSNLCTMFKNGRTYPRVNDMQQVTNMQKARSMNADPNKSYPFAEGGYHSRDTYIVSQEVFYGTKYLHPGNKFGSGISSNDSCNSETTWKQNGGIRYKLSGSDTWKYAAWSTQGDIYYTADGTRTNFNILLSLEHPKEQCMESQMVASYAAEVGIPEGEEFEFYGGTYWYQNVPGAVGLLDGEMNVRVYKKMSQTFNAYDVDGTEQSWDVEVILRMSLIGGMALSGDIFCYHGGGLEIVGTLIHDVNESRVDNPVDIYIEPDQTKWHSETAASKPDGGVFDFESSYRKAGTYTNLGDSYTLKRLPYTSWKIEKGGSYSTGQCYYHYDNTYWGSALNTRYRIGSRFRGYAYYGNCSPRFVNAFTVATHASRNSAGSAQALIKTQ